MQLRPYQLAAVEAVEGAVAEGKNPLLVKPTGAGKTVVAAELIRRRRERGQRLLFLAPRRELVAQTSRTLGRLGIGHGVILAGADAGGGLYEQVQVASIDTLVSRVLRRERMRMLPDPNLILIDEAHLSITNTRRALLARWPHALRIGLTATPTRKDGRALGVLYDKLIEPVTVADLQRDGYLSRARYYSLSAPDLARVRTVAGDFHQGELEEAVNRPELVGDVVSTWLARAATRRTLVFATSIAHSAALCAEFLRAGVAAEHVDANTPQEMRDALFERFRTGATQVVTNCFLASYGFDLPELDCVVLARPTKSLMLYLQMLGRGLRTAAGKSDCLVLDHSGCVHRFGFAHDERVWTLEGKRALVEREQTPRERRESKLITCPQCAETFSGARLCPGCGYFFAPTGKEVETLAGELIEIGEHLEPEKQDRAVFYAELRGIGIERHWKPTAAAVQFREKFGEWPPRSWNHMAPARPSEETRRWVQSRLIAYQKARARMAA